MKKFKQIDFWISVILISASTVLSIINQDYTLFVCYFIVGGWQVISMIIHAIFKCFTNKDGRRFVYHCIVCCIICAALLGFVIPEMFLVLAYPMLFAAPFMAIYYTWLCYDEVYVKMQRPLSLLK